MATINLDGDETVLYGPGFQTTVLSPGIGATERGILLITDPAEGDMLVYEDGVFQNHTLTEVIDEALGLTELDQRFVNLDGDTMTGALIVDHTLTVNESGADRDVRIEGDTATSLFVTDAGLDAVQIGTTTAGVIADFRSSAITFNEDGSNRDVRIEGDTDANLVFTDASADKVGIGTSAPSSKLHVAGDATVESGSSPAFRIIHTGAAADAGRWKLTGATDGLRLQALLDNDSVQELPLRFVRSGSHVSQITLNDSSADTDVVVKGDTATNLFVADAGLDAVQIGTTTAGVIADFRSSAIVFNENGADRDVRIEGDTATSLLVTDAGLDAVQIGTTSAGDIADFRSGSIVLNESGADRDTRIEGDTDANLLYVDAGADKVGIGTNAPTAKLDVNSDTLRLRTAKTPASAAAAGTQGDIAWDSGFVYVCVATNTWKRAAIATW